ncbi:sulfate-binding protein [Pseudanabaena sp. SR411]|uniref:sulfate ABC transporter substrate-binding protein n=1 Tax=Pseudanabaena sp. SR411 TaxID=1980935 RepID=UPI000B9988BE|nr:sulfate ABC transporter substrate-binding protein [Pseudanabaena sp. SR411]OYQ66031.1 sulfate-binding protein [Pseudanabaena sp. SR411]
MSSRYQQPLGKFKGAIKAIASLVSNILNNRLGRKCVSLFLVGALISVTMAACNANTGNPTANTGSPSAGAPKKDVELTLVSFAVTKQAHENIIPKFVEKWQKEQNQKVVFRQSYGGSGSQTRAVIDGLEADIVHLAVAADTSKIEKAGLIDAGWEKEYPSDGIVSKSVPAIIVREGNPKNIKTWSDLEKVGVSLITADPKTSGVARWNFLAIWNSAFKANNKDEAKTVETLTKVFTNVPILTKDAREASDAFFKQGQGDVLVNYENEVILASQKGEKVNYVIPEVNFSIENPIAIVDKNVAKHGTKEVAEAFVKFLYSTEAQTEFAKVGFRPVDEAVAKEKQFVDLYPVVKDLASVKDYGGWGEIDKKFFADGGIFDQIQSKIKR